MATATDNVDEIRKRMAEIRLDLHHDVKNVVEGANVVADWRSILGRFPWVAVGAAFGLGYLVVPRRRRSVERAVERAVEKVGARGGIGILPEVPLVTRSEETKEKRKSGLIGAAFGILSPIIIRMAQGYAVQFMENWLQQQNQMAMAMMQGKGTGPGPGGPGPAAGKPGGSAAPGFPGWSGGPTPGKPGPH